MLKKVQKNTNYVEKYGLVFRNNKNVFSKI